MKKVPCHSNWTKQFCVLPKWLMQEYMKIDRKYTGLQSRFLFRKLHGFY